MLPASARLVRSAELRRRTGSSPDSHIRSYPGCGKNQALLHLARILWHTDRLLAPLRA